MEPTAVLPPVPPQPTSLGALSRRGVLQGAAAAKALGATTLGAAALAAGAAPVQAQAGPQIVAYVGAYTDRGKGIHMFYVDPADGTLVPWKVLDGLPSPSSLAFDPSKKYLYAVNEIANFGGAQSGSVTAIAVDPASGDLRIINVVSSQGAGPAHLSVDPSGRFVFAANYGGGSVAVLPIRPDGSLGEATDVQAISGPLGPQPAQDAPPGSFAISGHDAPHAHMAQTDPAGRYLFVSDLGTDRIYSYRFDNRTGKLTPNSPPFVQATPGAGPRHFDFHPNGRWVYSLNEEASTVDVMAYNAGEGSLTIRQTLSSLPEGYEGTNFPSEIHVAEDGRFVYAANRLHDTIAIFSVNAATGLLTALGHVWTRGSYPRHFAIEPTGSFLYVLHSRSDNVTAFSVDRVAGLLEFTGKFTGVGNPSKIVFLALGAPAGGGAGGK
jgi:6-phosphogluconolactonase (cycloisomerase 2 family)